MLFSYYFDTDKQHVVNCGVDITSVNEKASREVEIIFTAYIEELSDGLLLKRESVNRIFTFPFNPSDSSNHDIDFLRKRYADEQKWILEVRNNKNSSQNIAIGLVSDTATRNPLGLDIIHDSNLYDSEVRANNLSEIDQQERGPIIKQTMAYANFTELGYPKGFISRTGQQDNNLKLIKANEFTQNFLEDIPENVPFVIEMNIAPESFDMKYEGDSFLQVNVPGLGVMKAYQDKITYLKDTQSSGQEIVTAFDELKNLSDFYSSGFTSDSNLLIEGDGRGSLVLRYGNKQIHTTYNAETVLSAFGMRGAITSRAIELPQELLSENWLKHKIDNIHVFYNK